VLARGKELEFVNRKFTFVCKSWTNIGIFQGGISNWRMIATDLQTINGHNGSLDEYISFMKSL
jgi:hypothetical protein